MKPYSGENWGLRPALSVMTDNTDVAATLLTEEIVRVLDKYQVRHPTIVERCVHLWVYFYRRAVCTSIDAFMDK